jgi:hypothetical protein
MASSEGGIVDDMHEIKELLREIRDLQKAHFDRYTEFTQSVLDRQQAGAEDVKRSREEQHRFREEMRRAVDEGRQQVKEASTTRWVVYAVVIILGVVSVGGVLLTIGLRMTQIPYE